MKVPPACAPAPDVRVSLLFRRASGIVLAAIAIGLSPASALAQSSTELDLGDEVHYPWTFTGAPGGFGSSSVENQTSRVLTVPVSIWLRRLTDGRKLGLRLRLTGVLGFQDFQGIEDFEI
ncbi:MAG: hypothetical protein Q8W46_06585, partial [Candidatus Palauibacterales bacterium]|nr:hypothetical protein [Candidatus Palauibacterales bacterium]